ncbi:MAG: PAS domain S-box protein, partial [Bdellovibrionales bacterium]|nr:PAS domain S-box protein [Bdellovibrionales bacterium]
MPTAKVLQLSPSAQLAAAQRYEMVFDHASDAICTVVQGRIEAANRALEELTGYLRQEIEGEDVFILEPQAGSSHVPVRSKSFSSEMLYVPGTYEDVAIIRKDGYVRLVDLTVRAVSGPELRSFTLLILRDVTAKKQMERELITKHAELRNAFIQLERNNTELKVMQETLVQAGKMAALGELAAGIAHELNQPLQAIRGYAQELQVEVAPLTSADSSKKVQVDSHLKQIVVGVDKMSAIIKYLRTFTRKSTEGY